jgi:hypothetical protein
MFVRAYLHCLVRLHPDRCRSSSSTAPLMRPGPRCFRPWPRSSVFVISDWMSRACHGRATPPRGLPKAIGLPVSMTMQLSQGMGLGYPARSGRSASKRCNYWRDNLARLAGWSGPCPCHGPVEAFTVLCRRAEPRSHRVRPKYLRCKFRDPQSGAGRGAGVSRATRQGRCAADKR